MRPYRYQLLLLVVDVALYALCMLLAPLLISFVVDNVIQGVPSIDAVCIVATWQKHWL